MKILQVTNFFKPSWEAGGPTRVVYEISKKLEENGHEVTVYTTDGYKSRLNVEKNVPLNIDGIKTYYFRNLSNYLSRRLVLPIPYYAPFVIRKNIKSFDIIHIHEYRTLLGVMVHYYAIKYNIPYVLQAHGTVLPFFEKQKLKQIFDCFFGSLLIDSKKLIALTEKESDQYQMMKASIDQIEIIPNGINFSEYLELPKKGSFREKYSLNKDEKIILYLGRIHKIKGIDILINSFSKVMNKYDNVKLILVGPDDGFSSVLNKQIESLKLNDKILFIGSLYDRDKLEAYVDADIFVLPSYSEGFPTTVLEACACETSVIISNTCSITDIIDNKVGYVVNLKDNQLCDLILDLLVNDDLRTKFATEGRKLVAENFDWSTICKKIERLYAECINSKDNLG
ncbi:glycosyltransferase [Methanosarcina soligelidi]|uniref:glycosyltransferase n=1 Tax=Methanosarcina soligelidi TaxID=1036677 RepID=UPI00064E82E3|nr:glycosyltransferase [Methanosarcina soligelidi]